MKGYHVVSLKLSPTPMEPRVNVKSPSSCFPKTVMISDSLSESSHAEDANDELWIKRSVCSNIKSPPKIKTPR